MKEYKLIAFDMDGTLLNSNKQVSAETLRAIKAAADHGKTMAICTGRCPAELKDYYSLIPQIRFYICMSGALVYDSQTKEILYSNAIHPEIMDKLLDITRKEDTFIQFMTTESIIQRDYLGKMELYRMSVYHDLYEKVTTRVDDIYGLYRRSPFDVGKFNIYHRDTDARLRTKKRIEEAGLPVILTFSEETSLEVSPLDTDKGTGLAALCSYLNIDLKNAVAVGDAYNDLPMLKAAGLAVAMGNSNDSVKENADVITGDNDHDGCAQLLFSILS